LLFVSSKEILRFAICEFKGNESESAKVCDLCGQCLDRMYEQVLF
jgi:hypothetical protein